MPAKILADIPGIGIFLRSFVFRSGVSDHTTGTAAARHSSQELPIPVSIPAVMARTKLHRGRLWINLKRLSSLCIYHVIIFKIYYIAEIPFIQLIQWKAVSIYTVCLTVDGNLHTAYRTDL